MLKQMWVLNASGIQWSEEAQKELQDIWANEELNNGSYFAWNSDANCFVSSLSKSKTLPYAQVYPAIHAYLSQNRIRECLIHWYW